VSSKSLRWCFDRLHQLFPPGQFLRYLGVGVMNTFFAYTCFAFFLYLLNGTMPQRLLYLAVMFASIAAFPINVTIAYLGYKFLVFRTRGNYIREWLRCFTVYGVGALPSLLALPAVTGLLQTFFHRHSVALHHLLVYIERPLSGALLILMQRITTGRALAGYLAGAIVVAASTIYTFLGHKNVTFRRSSA
jgi:putative flippase GtrA